MTIKYIQNTFAGGIIDPTLQARTDMGLRYNSCKNAKNILFLPSGACVNRTGTKYVVTSGTEKVAEYIGFDKNKCFSCKI